MAKTSTVLIVGAVVAVVGIISYLFYKGTEDIASSLGGLGSGISDISSGLAGGLGSLGSLGSTVTQPIISIVQPQSSIPPGSAGAGIHANSTAILAAGPGQAYGPNIQADYEIAAGEKVPVTPIKLQSGQTIYHGVRHRHI
jgi:hypothetical protein